tara:strand:+ start:219 stop:779 length:561 start_codon:yes stop_codon:yes gene_type:complete
MNKFKNYILPLLSVFIIYPVPFVYSNEQIISQEELGDNISITFEAAPKDTVFNDSVRQLSENETDIHIEALVNWNDGIQIEGQLAEGFIPYVNITSEIINENSGRKKIIDLTPHINLSDGFHYAKNIKLPGLRTDKYKLIFTITPDNEALTYHMDWKEKYPSPIFEKKVFEYSNLDFKETSEATRR